MTYQLIIQILANAVILLAYFYISYLKEKGKNLATKEDIGAITTIIEKIKTELRLVSKTQEVVYDDERKAIIEFVGAVTDFYESNINIPNEENSPEGIAYMRERIRVIEFDYGKLQIASSKLDLFCFDDKILKAAEPVILDLLNFKHHTQQFRFKVLMLQQIGQILSEEHQKMPNDENLNKFKQNLAEIGQTQKEFEDLKLNYNKDSYISKYHNLLYLCKDYLKTKKALE